MKSEHPKGFTLIEVIMATLILIMGMGIVGSIIARISRANFFSQRHTQAVILSQNKIEELLNEGYNSSNLSEGDYENPLNPVNSTGDSSGVFFQYWSVQDIRPIDRSKQITSTIQWVGMDGESKSVILTATCIDQSN